MDTDDEFCLKWNNHHSTFLTVLHSLLKREVLVDVTLAAEGKFIEAHRLVLSTCSEYFQDALKTHENKHAFIFLNNVAFEDLQALIDYMYIGEVNVSQEQLPRFLATAEALKIKGLSDKGDSSEKLGRASSPVQPKQKNASKQIAKSSKPSTTNSNITSSASNNRQTRPSSQQIIVPHHTVPQSSQVANTSTTHSTNSSEAPQEPALTPDVNFVAVDDNHHEIEIEKTETDGLGTLGKVWSMNQEDDDDGVWENAVDLLAVEASGSVNQDDVDCHNASSEPDNAMEYHRYSDSIQNTSSTHSEDVSSAPSSTNKTDKWLSSIPSLRSSRSARGKSSNVNVSGDFSYKCPNCGRVYTQKGSLNRHMSFECGNIAKFPCQLCPMRFRRAYKLTEHFKRIHGNQSIAYHST